MPAPANCLIIVVSYRNNAQLISFLEQPALLPSCTQPTVLHILAVANGLTPHEQSTLHSAVAAFADPKTRLSATDANHGYFGGAALGLSHYLHEHPLPDWVIVTNDDIYFDQGFFPRLSTLPLPVSSGVVAPDIQVPTTGVHQNPYLLKRLSRFHLEASLVLYRHAWLYRMFVKVRQALTRSARPPSTNEPASIYAPHGSCILFHADYFRGGGTLEHPAFLYGEENFVAETCAKNGLLVRYEPSLRVEHHEHSTMGKVSSKVHLRYMYDATKILLERYYW